MKKEMYLLTLSFSLERINFIFIITLQIYPNTIVNPSTFRTFYEFGYVLKN